mgnify:CR=1 FL=1
MTTSTPPGSSFYIVPYSTLVDSTNVVITGVPVGYNRSSVNESETVSVDVSAVIIAKLVKAVQDNPTPK